MSNVYFISDLHFGHVNILKHNQRFKEDGTNWSSVEECWQHQIDCINSVVHKKDIVYLLGDIYFSYNMWKLYEPQINGTKKYILGNHDYNGLPLHTKYEVFGLKSYKGFWLSHAPIHPAELRNKWNIHGHIHHKEQCLGAPYINVNMDVIGYYPISLEEIRELKQQT